MTVDELAQEIYDFIKESDFDDSCMESARNAAIYILRYYDITKRGVIKDDRS